MKHLNKTALLLAVSLTALLVAGCTSGPSDLEPIINGKHEVAKTYYPSTDDKVSAVIVTKKGDVYYYRANRYGTLRDERLLFNVHDFFGNQ